MPRSNSALARSFPIAGPRIEGLRRALGPLLARPDLLRRAVPVLIAAFAALAAVGLVAQTLQARHVALAAAEERLALMADLAALRLKDHQLIAGADWQGALAQSLPKGATLDDRMALLADADGKIRARAPIVVSSKTNLLDIVGPEQPLTTFGAEAGVLRLTLTDGTDAIVTVRNVPDTGRANDLDPADRRRALPAGAATRVSKSASSSAPAWCWRCSAAVSGISDRRRRASSRAAPAKELDEALSASAPLALEPGARAMCIGRRRCIGCSAGPERRRHGLPRHRPGAAPRGRSSPRDRAASPRRQDPFRSDGPPAPCRRVTSSV